jgi:hypothetical protein
MSKNLTRKGLALGAVVALGSTLFAGSPALAAPTALALDTAFGTSGTSQNAVLGQHFTLASNAVGASNNDSIKYYVEGVAAADLSIKVRQVVDLGATTSGDAYADVTGTFSSSTGRLVATDNAAKTSTFISPDWIAGEQLQFALKLNNITSTTAIKVTPFLDSYLADNKPGANELVGTPVTITYHKTSELVATPTLGALVLGVTAKATVAFDKAVNVEQFRAAANGGLDETPVTVQFKENGADFGGARNVLWNTTSKTFVAESSGTVTAGRTYGAVASFGSTASGSATVATAAAGEVGSLSGVAGARGDSYRAAAFASSSDVIRAGAGKVTVSTTVTPVAGKSKAGQKVTFKVEENGANLLDSAASVTAGGKTLTNTNTTTVQDFSVEVVSDADGKASLEITYTGVKAANQIKVTASANGASAVVPATALVLTGQDSTAAALVDLDASAGSTPVRQIAKGSALSIGYQVVDQFGQVPVGTFQVLFTNDAAGNERLNHAATAELSSGKVTFSATDASTADGDYIVTAQLQKKNTSGNWENVSGVSETSTVQVAAVATPGSFTLTVPVTTDVARYGATLVAGNTQLELENVSRVDTGNATIDATLLANTGAQADGVAVTFTAPGVLFKSGTVYGLGSITVLTNASGATGAVSVYSNTAGKVTVTISAGSVTKTQDITFASVSTGGSAWTLVAPATMAPGKTFTVSATLKDKFGNAVNSAAGDVKVVYDGPGFVTAVLPTETDSDGKLSFTVLLGASDTGTAKVTVTYEGANGEIGETTANDDVVATSSIVIAAPVVVVPEVKTTIVGVTKAVRIRVENAKGEEVEVKFGSKTVAVAIAGTNSKLWVLKTTKGKKSVKVYVDGDLVAVKTVTVK